jgi:hypothetical protein
MTCCCDAVLTKLPAWGLICTVRLSTAHTNIMEITHIIIAGLLTLDALLMLTCFTGVDSTKTHRPRTRYTTVYATDRLSSIVTATAAGACIHNSIT